MQSKQEGLQLHSILAGAEAAAAIGNHTAVVEALVPVVVCCGAKEQEMQQLHHPQWLHGVQLLLAAATEALDWALALRCHLRLLTSVLPAVPPLLAGETRHRSDLSGSEADAAAAGWASLPAALSAASDQLAVQPAAVAALDSAAAFLQRHGAHLILEGSPPPSATSATNDALQQQQQQQRVALHPAEQGVYTVVQRQLQLAVAACAAALKLAGPVAAESRLCLKVGRGSNLLLLPNHACLHTLLCALQYLCIHPPLCPPSCRSTYCVTPCVTHPPCCSASAGWPAAPQTPTTAAAA